MNESNIVFKRKFRWTFEAKFGELVVKLTVKAASSQTANLQEWQDSSGTALASIAKNGAFVPASLADTDAANGTIYYSTDASKLVYKDSGGTVNNLY